MKRTTTILIAICVSALFANGKQISQNAALSAARKYSRTGQVAPAKNLLSDSPSVVVEPLVSTKWNQDAPFNNFAPEYTDDNNNTQRCATGCAATAMAQIMKFHNWPEQGVGHYSYEHQSFGTISSNFSERLRLDEYD